MVSVIVPVYNAEKFLNETIDSILRQTYSDFEILLIDDGSTDRSEDICDEYAKKDKRVHVFHKENKGVSSARNFGLKEAKGEWILFVDSDDYIRKDMIETLLKHSDGMDCVVCGYKRVLNDGRFKDEYVTEKMCYDTSSAIFREKFDSLYLVVLMSVWSGLYSRDSIEHLFNEDAMCNEDVLFNIDYMLDKRNICLIPDILYYYRIDTSNSLTKKIWLDDYEYTDCITKQLKLLLKDSFINQKNTIFRSIVNRTYCWMKFIVKTDKISDVAKQYIIGSAISKDYFNDPDIPIELYDEKYQKLWHYARNEQIEEIFKLLN